MRKKFILILALILISITVYSQQPPTVILVSFDGFRWDYLHRGITPNLQKIIDNGVHALSLQPSFPSKTFPNHYSIITGMYPQNHGLISNSFYDHVEKDWYGMRRNENEWYLGEPFWQTAQRNGILAASYFWPGSEQDIESRRPKYFKAYNHDEPYLNRIDGVIEWLKYSEDKRPNFITLYFHDTDSYGHEFGPNSPEINESIKRIDSVTAYLISSLKDNKLSDVNLIFVSDHGMTEISRERIINIEEMLSGYNCFFEDSGPLMRITPPSEKLEEVFDLLKKNEKNFTAYKRKDVPKHFNYSNHPFIGDIVLIAEMGWSLADNRALKRMERNYSKGDHGYDNHNTDMHGIFIAYGPKFKSSYKTGTLLNIDIYPLLCKIFEIDPRSNIDGSLDRIEFILND